MKNGHRSSLDLSDLVEPISITIGDYNCTLSGDMSLTALARMGKAFTRLGESVEGKVDAADLGISEDEMWDLVEEVMSKASPPPPSPARELLTTAAAIKLLAFLAGRVTESLMAETSSLRK